jgi:hypothetical protein
MEYDEDSGKYYCANCDKHWEPDEAEQKKTIYQDTTENPAPDTISYWDEDASKQGEAEEDKEAADE